MNISLRKLVVGSHNSSSISQFINRARGGSFSRVTQVHLTSWFILAAAIAIPFLAYIYRNGLEIPSYPSAGSAWGMLPFWLLRTAKWVGLSAIISLVLASFATPLLLRIFDIREGRLGSELGRRLRVTVPVVLLAAWLLPPLVLLIAVGDRSASQTRLDPTLRAVPLASRV